MKATLDKDGFEILHGVLSASQIGDLRCETDKITKVIGSTCVRHLRARSELIDALSKSEAILSLIPNGLRPVRSILFDKTETENWPVHWHQDLTIAVKRENDISGYGPWSHKDGSPHVQPPISLLQHMATVRLHLDDAPATNGALRVIPGSHLNGRISADDLSTYDKNNAVTCECFAGDVVLMSPLVLHSSRRSEIPSRRRVIHLEYARDQDLDSSLEWFED